LHAFDPLTQTPIWTSTKLGDSTYQYGHEVAVFDLDSDEVSEIIATSTNSVFVYHKVGDLYAVKWSDFDLTNAKKLAIAYMNGAGQKDIVVARVDEFLNSSVITVINGDTFAEYAEFQLPYELTDMTVTSGPNGRDNLLVALNNEEIYYYGQSGFVAEISGDNGNIVWRSPPLIGAIQLNSIHYKNIDTDKYPELLIGTSDAMYITR
jgi:hypothetical protein